MLAGDEAELPADVVHLGDLRLIEVPTGVSKIAAGILHVAIEEAFVERGGQVIMHFNVAPCSGQRIVLSDPAQPGTGGGGGCGKAPRPVEAGIAGDEGEEPGHIVPTDGQPSLRVAFAKRQFGVEQEPQDQAGIADRKMMRLARAVSEPLPASVRPCDPQIPFAQNTRDHAGKNALHHP